MQLLLEFDWFKALHPRRGLKVKCLKRAFKSKKYFHRSLIRLVLLSGNMPHAWNVVFRTLPSVLKCFENIYNIPPQPL